MPPMRAFGDENQDYITTKLLLKELKKCKSLNHDVSGVVDRFTKLIHANPAHPENHNVLFKSLNGSYAKVFNGKQFEDRQSGEVQDIIMQNVGVMFSNRLCDQYEYKDDKEDMDEVLDQLDISFCDREGEVKSGDNTRALGKCRNAIKAALYSNKDAIVSTHSLIE